MWLFKYKLTLYVASHARRATYPPWHPVMVCSPLVLTPMSVSHQLRSRASKTLMASAHIFAVVWRLNIGITIRYKLISFRPHKIANVDQRKNILSLCWLESLVKEKIQINDSLRSFGRVFKLSAITVRANWLTIVPLRPRNLGSLILVYVCQMTLAVWRNEILIEIWSTARY